MHSVSQQLRFHCPKHHADLAPSILPQFGSPMGAATSRFGPCWPRRRRSPQDEPYLTDDVLVEVFLRLPPHPDCLRRVSLVSRRFRRVVTGRRFLARFRGIHGGAPQLVGLFHNHNHGDDRFVPVGVDGSGYFRRRAGPVGRPPRGPLSPGDAQWNILGCRGGRVLLLSPDRLRLLVLEPMLGRRQYFPAPPAPVYKPSCFSNAAVVTADSGHDELSTHLFRVVFVSCNAASKRSTVFIYNSAAFRWTKVATAEMSSVVDGRPSVLIGQVLYWHLVSHGIISFNLETHELHEILVPADAFDDVHEASLNIVVPKGGGVGLAAVSGYILQMWTLRNFTHGASTWDLRKIVRLDALLPLRNARFAAPPPTPTAKHPLVWMMALDEDKNVGYIWTMVGVFAVQLDSMKYHKVIGAVCRGMDLVYPYKTFFLPAVSSATMIM